MFALAMNGLVPRCLRRSYSVNQSVTHTQLGHWNQHHLAVARPNATFTWYVGFQTLRTL